MIKTWWFICISNLAADNVQDSDKVEDKTTAEEDRDATLNNVIDALSPADTELRYGPLEVQDFFTDEGAETAFRRLSIPGNVVRAKELAEIIEMSLGQEDDDGSEEEEAVVDQDGSASKV